MISAWTKHLKDDPKAKKKFEEYIKSNKELFDRLEAILDELETGLVYSELSIDSFKDPSWAYAQAFKNGYRTMLVKMRTIINMDAKE